MSDRPRPEELNDFSRYPIQDVNTIATRMEHAAERLRKLAENFRNEKVDSSSVLADIFSEYLAATGNNGTYFDNLVRDVEQLRAHRSAGAR